MEVHEVQYTSGKMTIFLFPLQDGNLISGNIFLLQMKVFSVPLWHGIFFFI